MAELAAEVCAVSAAERESRTAQAWRTVLGWLTFLLRVLLQILPAGTPSLAHLLSLAGFRHRLLSSSSASADPAFQPLPTDAPPPPPPQEPLAKLTVVLDLDETLVCAYETSSVPSVVRSHAIGAGVDYFELECTSTDKEVEGKQNVNHVTVFERPGLHEFLRETSKFADLVLFTAGLEDYARPLVDRIDVENRFSLRLYRPATTNTEYREHVKDLSCISENLSRIVIVDNNPFSFLLQPLNGIPCVPFFAGQPYDEQLMGVILPLLKTLSMERDVRPVLRERFHMPEWFQKHGIPSFEETYETEEI